MDIEDDLNLGEDSTEDKKKKRAKRLTPEEKAQKVLQKGLFDRHYTPWTFVNTLLTNKAFANYQIGLYREDGGELDRIMDALWSLEPLRAKMMAWFRPKMLEYVEEEIHKEFDAAKPAFYMTSAQMTPEFIEHYDFLKLADKVREKMPVWNTVINAATQSPKAAEKNKRKDPYLVRS
ncbi:hypothetical protein MPER_02982 [Moniliophthora perniciosa FA553]|nr:hypothetical protein MPER_02982 [Moniliophthora perniciosa FA553]